MNKAVLEIDMPVSCLRCPFSSNIIELEGAGDKEVSFFCKRKDEAIKCFDSHFKSKRYEGCPLISKKDYDNEVCAERDKEIEKLRFYKFYYSCSQSDCPCKYEKICDRLQLQNIKQRS